MLFEYHCNENYIIIDVTSPVKLKQGVAHCPWTVLLFNQVQHKLKQYTME